MPEVSIEKAMQIALRQHQAGQLREAETIYRQVLGMYPAHPDALHLLGQLCAFTGRAGEAIDLLRCAVEAGPADAQFCLSLANALASQQQLEEAALFYRRAIERKPEFPEAYNNLGGVLSLLGRFDESLSAYQTAIALRPGYVDAHANLGLLFMRFGKLNEATDAFQKAIELDPKRASSHHNLAIALMLPGKFDDALAAIDRAVELAPQAAILHSLRGELLRRLDRVDEAIAECRKATELDPNLADTFANLGNVLMDVELRESILQFQRSVQVNPNFSELHSNLLLALHYDSRQTPQAILPVHRAWAQRHAEPLTRASLPHRSPGPDAAENVLTIGYVSPDFRDHPIARFLRPILQSHDHAKFRIVCYSDVQSEDDVTRDFRSRADLWRDVKAMDDAPVARLIREDEVDILVDLALHTARNRLLVFARRPAPIQVTYLAYPGTSGMSAMDYRLTDPHLDPPGNEKFYTEKSLALSRTYWCYSAPGEAPQVASLPALSNGYVTFGSLNRLAKVSDECLATWAKILAAVPNSRLMMHARQGRYLDRLRAFFTRENVSSDRIIFLPHQSQERYFATYNQIDIALDPFPYGGGTTSCDAMWMGVPMITCAGTLAVHRAGVSLLNNLGMPQLIADDDAAYVDRAVQLASDLPRLGNLRETLRERMRSSPLMDAVSFTRDLEEAYRKMWRDWCHFGNKNIST